MYVVKESKRASSSIADKEGYMTDIKTVQGVQRSLGTGDAQ
jgi:hypothetical protein